MISGSLVYRAMITIQANITIYILAWKDHLSVLCLKKLIPANAPTNHPAATSVRSCFSDMRHLSDIAFRLSSHRMRKVMILMMMRYRQSIRWWLVNGHWLVFFGYICRDIGLLCLCVTVSLYYHTWVCHPERSPVSTGWSRRVRLTEIAIRHMIDI